MSELLEQLAETIARRAAQIVLEQLDERRGNPDARDYLTVSEAAELYGCKPQRIYELRSDGRLTPYKEGGRAMVKRTELDNRLSTDRRAH